MADNKLTRFVESCSVPNKMIVEANSEAIRESLTRIPLKFKESLNDETRGWWVPISHYGNYVNGNGRIYNTKLWENVINNQKDVYCGSAMLADHPAGDSDGNPKDICGVWLDAKLGQPNENGIGIVYGLLVPSGTLGRDLQDHLRNGLKIGTSSSGFGKLLKDGKTVDPDTYQIERLADFVMAPSQLTYFMLSSDGEIEDCTITESSSQHTQNQFTEDITNNTSSTHVADINNTNYLDTIDYKEKVVKDSKFTKLEEKKFRRDMESFLESADNIKDPQERLNEFKEIKSYLEEGACPDLKEKVEAKIVEQEEAIKQMLNESITLKEELGIESTKDLKVKLTKVVENTKLAEKEAKDWKTISEKLQNKLDEANQTIDSRPTPEFTEFQKNKINSLTEQMTNHDAKATELVNNLVSEYKKIKESKNKLEEQVKSLQEQNTNLNRQLKASGYGKQFFDKTKQELEERCVKAETSLKEANDNITKLNATIKSQKSKLSEAIKDIKELKTLNEKTSNRADGFAKEAKDAQLKIRKEEIRKIKEQKSKLTETEQYFEDLYNQYGNEVIKYKEKIVKARSLVEAKRIFFKDILQNLGESQKIIQMRKPTMVLSIKESKADNETDDLTESAVDRLPKGWK